jgi:hypothetical protein
MDVLTELRRSLIYIAAAFAMTLAAFYQWNTISPPKFATGLSYSVHCEVVPPGIAVSHYCEVYLRNGRSESALLTGITIDIPGDYLVHLPTVPLPGVLHAADALLLAHVFINTSSIFQSTYSRQQLIECSQNKARCVVHDPRIRFFNAIPFTPVDISKCDWIRDDAAKLTCLIEAKKANEDGPKAWRTRIMEHSMTGAAGALEATVRKLSLWVDNEPVAACIGNMCQFPSM